MANNNYYAVYDTETSSVNPEICQVLSIGIVMVHPKKLEIVEGGEFYSLIQPEDVSTIEPEALKVNKLNLDDLAKAPKLETVWKNFLAFMKQYKTSNNSWGLPISAGYNIINYDNIIMSRLAKRFGTVTKDGRPDIFHPRDTFDCMCHMFHWLECRDDIKSYSFDNIRKLFGIKQDNAHNALSDAKDAAKLMIRLLKFYRTYSPKMKFDGCFERN